MKIISTGLQVWLPLYNRDSRLINLNIKNNIDHVHKNRARDHFLM